MHQAWLHVSGSEGQGHGVPAVFLLNPVVDREGLQEQWMDSAVQLLVVQPLLTRRITVEPSLRTEDCWEGMGSTSPNGTKVGQQAGKPAGE